MPVLDCPLLDFSMRKKSNKPQICLSHNFPLSVEENSRMGKTGDLFKKVRDTKGIFHAKMGSIQDRNGMDLKEVEGLRRGGNNTQKNYTKKIFITQITMMMCSLTYSQTYWSVKSSGP